jgi:YspA, cpYpsA-related SLOG family
MGVGRDGIDLAKRIHRAGGGGEREQTLRAEFGWDADRFKLAMLYARKRDWIAFAYHGGFWFLAVPGADVPDLDQQPAGPERWVMVCLDGEQGPATFAIGARGGVVFDAPPVAEWALGRPTSAVAAYYQGRGAVFVPIKDAPRVVTEPAPVPRRVLVTGSRDWPDPGVIEAELGRLLAGYGALLVIHGDRGNVDKTARRWAEARKAEGQPVDHEPYPVTAEQWAEHPKSAGHIRNVRMVKDGRPDECLAFIAQCARRGCHRPGTAHGSHGATGCATIARRAGVPVTEFTPVVAGARVPGMAD